MAKPRTSKTFAIGPPNPLSAKSDPKEAKIPMNVRKRPIVLPAMNRVKR